MEGDVNTVASEGLNRDPEDVTVNSLSPTGVRRLQLLKRLKVKPRALSTGVDADLSIVPPSDGTSNLIEPNEFYSAITSAQGDTLSIAGVPSLEMSGQCGNGVCEVGEQCDSTDPSKTCCAEDCKNVISACPVANGEECNGKGRCATGSGSCFCYAGYVGTACEQCGSGLVLENNVCVKVVVAPSATPSAAATASASAAPAAQSPSATPVAIIAGEEDSNSTILIAVLSVVGVVAVVGGVLVFMKYGRSAKRKRGSKPIVPVVDLKTAQDGTVYRVKEDSPTNTAV